MSLILLYKKNNEKLCCAGKIMLCSDFQKIFLNENASSRDFEKVIGKE